MHVQAHKNAALPHTPRGPNGIGAIQRTVWRYSGTTWVNESSSSSDTDTHPAPTAYCLAKKITPKKNDKYDQQTGVYKQWAKVRGKTLARARKKKRPKNFGRFFTASRETTPFGYFKPRLDDEIRNKGLQGPHLLSHVTKRTIFDMAEDMGLNPAKIVGSKLIPKPRQALQIMLDMLKDNVLGAKPGAISTWYRDYKRAYGKAMAQDKGWKQGLKEALELHPLTTYRVGAVASSTELASKKEDAEVAVSDIDLLLSHPRTGGLPVGLTTIDSGYKAEGWTKGDKLREDFVFNYAYMSIGRCPSPCPYDEAPKSPTRDDDW